MVKLNPHLPIIMRIEFSSLSHSHLAPAIITPHIDFADVWVENNRTPHTVSPSDTMDSDDDSVSMNLASEASDDEILLNNNEKIPKQPGEPGQPNSGGYNIKNEVR